MIKNIYQTLRKYSQIIYQFLIELLFPRRCPICDQIARPYGRHICEKCHDKIQYIGNITCQKCGKKLNTMEAEFCHDCSSKTHLFDKGRALYEYESIREALYRMKYSGRKEYAEFFALELSLFLKAEILKWNADALIPVPLHFARQRKRGFNQSQLLAEHLGDLLGIPVRSNLIKRCKKTVPQKELSLAERQNNLKKAFKISQYDVKLKTIIVIDDIFTTGSTIDAMSSELRRAGVQKIYFITLAIGEGI